jgi:hypothetical protein
MTRKRRYFIVKHGLEDFEMMPNYIWRTHEREQPSTYTRVKQGDRWIAFAYNESDTEDRPLRLITGFFECVRELKWERLPAKVAKAYQCENAWTVKGLTHGKQPKRPVAVPPIDELLTDSRGGETDRHHFKGQVLVPIDKNDFEYIKEFVLSHQMDPRAIKPLNREPRNEQEVLAVVLASYQQLGIERILRIRTGFPDLLVKLQGRSKPVHIELETYSSSFFLHGHDKQVCDRIFKSDDDEEKLPVVVLCWIDDAKRKGKLAACVHKVYELQSLFRDKERIRW